MQHVFSPAILRLSFLVVNLSSQLIYQLLLGLAYIVDFLQLLLQIFYCCLHRLDFCWQLWNVIWPFSNQVLQKRL